MSAEFRWLEPHGLHSNSRVFPETNCYTDLWIEVLHALDLDPVAGMAFLLSSDFNGDQWELFKYPQHDLRLIYGIRVSEINIWRPLIEHIETHLSLGQLVTVEVDAHFLPDRAGTSYRVAHEKTTIAVSRIDRQTRKAQYIHARGLYEVEYGDFDALFGLGTASTGALPPYVEVIDTSNLVRLSESELSESAVLLVRDHLVNRAHTNPVARLGERIRADIRWLIRSEEGDFHKYAFGTLRQLGAWATTTSEFVAWLRSRDQKLDAQARRRLQEAEQQLARLGSDAKSTQFRLARVLAGKEVDLSSAFDDLADLWQGAFDQLGHVFLTDACAAD